MNILERIDALVLSFFAKISHKFQRTTGRTNFFLANICLTAFAMVVVVNIINYWFFVLNKKSHRANAPVTNDSYLCKAVTFLCVLKWR